MDLSPHFTLEKLCFSDTALRIGIGNTPNAGEIDNLRRLCGDLLEPAQSILGVPLVINSGFRCPALNAAVGGATGSAHMDGRAADFKLPNGMVLLDAFDAMRRSSLPYDQIIFECGAWIHLAIAQVGVDPRRQALKATGKPGAWQYVRVG